MRSSTLLRHLPPANRQLKTFAAGIVPPLGDEFTPRDRASYLLHIDAEIEHCLMVQYLYAAYSLGGPQVPAEHRDTVRGWQEIILGIAKEEMGHLVTVQNVLRLIGAPLNFNREDFPWDVPFYPFPFMLEPLTLDSLAKYVYAESPMHWSGPLADEIRTRVEKATPSPHTVSELFHQLIPLVENPRLIPDAAFQAATVPFQASFSEWGRGYVDGERGNTTRKHPPKTPNVIVEPLASRDDAVAGLKAIAEQGEATTAQEGDGPSHFARFVKIYQEMSALAPQGWAPARPAAVNPFVSLDPEADPADATRHDVPATRIVDREAALWARLHNVRYRLLLTSLQHSFVLDGGAGANRADSPRGAVINIAFGEMYNLRALSELLMQLPLDADHPERGNAGPPFQVPYTMDTPNGEPNRWRLLLDLLDASAELVRLLHDEAPPARQTYLHALHAADARLRTMAQRILDRSIDLTTN